MRRTENTLPSQNMIMIGVFMLLSLYSMWQDILNAGTAESTDPRQKFASDLLFLVATLTSIMKPGRPTQLPHDPQTGANSLSAIITFSNIPRAILGGCSLMLQQLSNKPEAHMRNLGQPLYLLVAASLPLYHQQSNAATGVSFFGWLNDDKTRLTASTFSTLISALRLLSQEGQSLIGFAAFLFTLAPPLLHKIKTDLAGRGHNQGANKLTKSAHLLLPTMAVLYGISYVRPDQMSLTTAAPALSITFLELCNIISRDTRLEGTLPLIALPLASLIMPLLGRASQTLTSPQECSPKTFEPFLEDIPEEKKQAIINLFNGGLNKQTLKKAYRILSLLFHPDKGGSQEEMAALNAAIEACIQPPAQ